MIISMSLRLGKRISELKASEFNPELRGGEGEPLVVGVETAVLCLTIHILDCVALQDLRMQHQHRFTVLVEVGGITG